MSKIETKMKKFASLVLTSTLTFASLNASDLLSKATGGVVNNNSFGIKKLDYSQMIDVKGGYAYTFFQVGNNGFGIAALPDFENELGVFINDVEATMYADRGICGIGETSCYYNPNSKTHLNSSRNRFVEFKTGLSFFGEYAAFRYGLAYTIQKEIIVDRYGNRHPLFKYGVGAYDRVDGSFHRIDSSAILNDNTIIRELRDNFKVPIENALNSAIR